MNNTFVDSRDGQEYSTIELNSQIWMAKNFNYDAGEGCCWDYHDNSPNSELFGKLYTWQAAKLICPKGWHLPTKEEWDALITSLGGLKKAYQELIIGGASGFDALLGGYRLTDDSFLNLGAFGNYWTASVTNGGIAHIYYFNGDSRGLFRSLSRQSSGASVRYVKD